MSRLRFLILAIALVILPACECGPFTACAATSSPQPSGSAALRPITVLLGFRPDVQFAPFYVGIKDGFYADAGLDVTLEHASGGDLVRLVADEQVEFGVADATDVMIARTSGIPVRYVSTLYQAFPVAVIGPRGSVPTDPAELAGKTIGTPGKFGSSWHALLALLDAGGLTADDVTIREYPQFNQAEGLLNGDVDLITGFRTNEPLQLEKQGMAVDMLTIDDIAPLPGPGIVASDAIINADPALVRAFTEATARAQQAVIDDPQVGLDAAIAMVPTLGEDRATGLAVLRATVGLWSEGGFDAGRIDAERWSAAFATMRRLGFIDGSVAVDEMIWTE
jgi:NitT/TauT family transport system substrate-binding protein